ncbi:MAG TPA: hypothetical protein VF395_12260, partial [Polyangiaceae bacterium]
FLKPAEVDAMCRRQGMETATVLGSRPKIGSAFFRMLRTGSVPADFEFTFTPSTKLGFTGYARKRPGSV